MNVDLTNAFRRSVVTSEAESPIPPVSSERHKTKTVEVVRRFVGLYLPQSSQAGWAGSGARTEHG